MGFILETTKNKLAVVKMAAAMGTLSSSATPAFGVPTAVVYVVQQKILAVFLFRTRELRQNLSS